MRVKLARTGLLLTLGLALLTARVNGQNPDTLDPEQSAAKANHLLKQAVDAMGGPTYRNNQEYECEGRSAQLDRNGGMLGYSFVHIYWHYPDKSRTEYEVKSTKGGVLQLLIGNLPIKGGLYIQLFAGDRGWTMDKSGVTEAEVTNIAEFQQAVKRQIHNVLLESGKEEGAYMRYGGLGIVDLRPVDWVEITDRDDRKIRLALDRSSHLPERTVVLTPNEEMHQNDEDITIYSNYRQQDGIQTPMQVSRERNGRPVYQLFFNSCRNNAGLPTDFFTRESLEKRFAQTGGKKK